MTKDSREWDAFISYASEDRAEVAAPLAALLMHLGLKIWFDKAELRIGDSLRERIDEGLRRSRYGIIILSDAFFTKHWPGQELNGFFQLLFDSDRDGDNDGWEYYSSEANWNAEIGYPPEAWEAFE